VQAEYRRFVRDRLFASARSARPAAGPNLHGRQRPSFVRDGPPPPPRAPARRQRELLLRMLLNFPVLIEAVEEEFAMLDIPESELDKLRREILQAEALRPGLDAQALQQHLVTGGFAATVDALLSPSVDSGFLVRRSDPTTIRGEWDHVIRMLTGAGRSALVEAENQLVADLTSENLARLVAARERALEEGRGDEGG